MLLKKMTVKEWIKLITLLAYIGGFAYFWGMTTNDYYLIIVFAFLFTQLVGGRLIVNLILDNAWHFRIKNRYLRLFANFIVNSLAANIIILLIRRVHSGALEEFLAGPVVYGSIFALIYVIYLSLSLELEKA